MFSLWNNAVHCMNFRAHAAEPYRVTSILGRVHAAFFNYHQFNEMTYMPDEIILARIMPALDFKFEKALYYHDGGCESDND